MSYPHERQYYRLSFPIQERPQFQVGAVVMPIIECSERGFRYEPARGHAPELGDSLEGRIKFRRGTEVEVAGTVTRRQDATLVLVLDSPGVPFSVLMAEQRHLRRHYPERFVVKSSGS
jgi:hypothetical protein